MAADPGDHPRPTIYINGRFLSQDLTGVQRFGAEIVKAIDRRLLAGDVPAPLADARFTLLVPGEIRTRLDLQRIGTRTVGRRSGHAWDQIDLAWAARSGLLVSLANTGPVLHRRHLVVLHDAQVFRRPDFFRPAYRAWHKALGRAYARTASIGTVSDFSRRELAAVLDLPESAIKVYPNGSEHLRSTVVDDGVLERLGLSGKRYFLVVGTLKVNKNLKIAAAASARLARPDIPLVFAGGDNGKVFGQEADEVTRHAVATGRVSDGELAALYRGAAAFIFPSLYEGFGIPPLEAMFYGCPVIASTAEAVVETCQDGAVYFDPHDPEALLALMRDRLAGKPELAELRPFQDARVAHYSWDRSAGRLLADLAVMARPGK